jgi:hypothetical protein
MKSAIAEVTDAMVSIERILSSFRLSLNAVGTVAQNSIASSAKRYDFREFN